jgi:hypothetical protein
MFTGQTTIGKVSARCPARTDPLVARMRLNHLFQGMDITPHGFPPHALLVIRGAHAPRGVSLGALHLRADWEVEMREEVSLNWRRAVPLARGRVPEAAEAVLFTDAGEWLASLALAVARREVERHWCWRASLGAGLAVSSTMTLVHAWTSTPRFIPAALVSLARWGEAARVLGALQPNETGTLLSALRAEFDLPRLADAINTNLPRAAHTNAERDTHTESKSQGLVGARRRADVEGRDATASADEGAVDEGGAKRRGTQDVSDDGAKERSSPPWKRWLSSMGSECERLPAHAQRLLAFGAALFHAPALARSRRFAEEVAAYVEGDAKRARETSDATSSPARRESKSRTRGVVESRSTNERNDSSDSTAKALASRGDDARAVDSDASTHSHTAREQESARGVKEPKTRQPTTDSPVVNEEVEETAAHVAPWAALEGCETRLGGALFLVNLFAGLHLPECFDEDYQLSEHITGWGLTELLTRALLGEACAEFERDALWDALAHLDGRAGGEPPAHSLRVGLSYRVPARWLKLFPAGDAAWVVREDEGRVVLCHPGGFTVAVRPLGDLTLLEAAGQLADEYRAQGVNIARLQQASAPNVSTSHKNAGRSFNFDDTLFFDDFSFIDRPSIYGGARLSPDLRRWTAWVFPFLKYALGRSLADKEETTDGDEAATEKAAAREMFVRRGRLYCTATHVDVVMEMRGVSFAARRAGLDASPGWVRDLMRVVAFHYE